MFTARFNKAKAAKKREKRYPLDRCRRVTAQIQRLSTKDIVHARAYLHDLSLSGIGLFSNIPFEVNEPIAIVIEQPRHLYIKGTVRWSNYIIPPSRVISIDPMPYRIGISFTFETPEERDLIRKYFEEISLK